MRDMINKLFCGVMVCVVLVTSIDLQFGINEAYAMEAEMIENNIIASGQCGYFENQWDWCNC